jgi:large subunit ribosomal protein L3
VGPIGLSTRVTGSGAVFGAALRAVFRTAIQIEVVNTMPAAILGKKIGMMRIFDEGGKAVPVTVVEAGPCVVVQRKTEATDGYEAIQVGYEDKKRARVNSPMTGHFESRGIAPKRYLREFGVEADATFEVGQVIKADIFEKGQAVDVIGTSKGKGFAGGMKRYHFKGGPATHGSKVHRAPQSGGATDAARVFRGTRKPGHMGTDRVTVKNLTVVEVDVERNVLALKGAVPGANGSLIIVRGR